MPVVSRQAMSFNSYFLRVFVLERKKRDIFTFEETERSRLHLTNLPIFGDFVKLAKRGSDGSTVYFRNLSFLCMHQPWCI